jgi:hypothetical protein
MDTLADCGDRVDETLTGLLRPLIERSRTRRLHNTEDLDPTRIGRDARQVAEEVVAHLSGLVGSEVRVTLEIDADIPSGGRENVVRIVTEDSRTLASMRSGRTGFLYTDLPHISALAPASTHMPR